MLKKDMPMKYAVSLLICILIWRKDIPGCAFYDEYIPVIKYVSMNVNKWQQSAIQSHLSNILVTS